MQTSVTQFPELDALEAGLKSLFRGDRCKGRQVDILDREPSLYATTFPSEIVTCRLADGRTLRLFCKYSADQSHDSYGHRGGVAYESEIYRHVLEPIQVSVPKFYGSHLDQITGRSWITLEYLDNSVRLSKVAQPPIVQAARWIGQFHAINEARIVSGPVRSLSSYSIEYYAGWAHRTSQFAGHLHQLFPWLAILCERFAEVVTTLLDAPATIIHGEYYPKNILFRNDTVYPIDWESAAVAAGEIDLASLTEGWQPEAVRECELAYQQTRWPDGPPAEFDRRVAISRIYLHFRWLGDRREWTHENSGLWRFEQLCLLGKKMDLF